MSDSLTVSHYIVSGVSNVNRNFVSNLNDTIIFFDWLSHERF